jgi:hypothetical protein
MTNLCTIVSRCLNAYDFMILSSVPRAPAHRGSRASLAQVKAPFRNGSILDWIHNQIWRSQERARAPLKMITAYRWVFHQT